MVKKNTKSNLKVTSINIPEYILDYVKQLVKIGLYANITEWFRTAAEEKIKSDLKMERELRQQIKENKKIISFLDESITSINHNGIIYKILSEKEKEAKIKMV